MAIGMATYLWGQKYLQHVGNLVVEEKGVSESRPNLLTDIFKQRNSLTGFSVMIVVAAVVYFSSGAWDYALLIAVLAFAVGVGIVIYNDGNAVEKDRILVTYLSFLIIIVFWGSFEQAGGLMNIYTNEKTNLALGSFQIPASWFQSVNAIFILMLAPLVGAFWGWWRHRGKESSSVFKMAIGVIIMGWGFLFMSKAATEVKFDDAGEIVAKSSMVWLILAYLFHTLGELCASPVALSFITKLSPARWVAFMMGAYFAATGLGNKVAGLLGESASQFGEFSVFTGIAVFCTIMGGLVLLIIQPLKRLTHGAEDLESDPT
jgi:POT family proton-dependent oligopeptide transporter